jgi:hypothetical protein
MNTVVLRKLLIAGAAISALSLAACGKNEDGADASTAAAEAAAAGASTVTDAAAAKDQASADALKAASDAAAAPATEADTAADAAATGATSAEAPGRPDQGSRDPAGRSGRKEGRALSADLDTTFRERAAREGGPFS